MNPFITRILPLVLAFFLGIVLKQLKLLSREDAPVLLRFVLNVSIPAVIILAIYRARLAPDMALIPICSMLVVFGVYVVSSLAGRFVPMPRASYGSFLVGTLIMNTAFALPFIDAAYGTEGLARASLFDIGNTFLIFTFTYYNAIKYGDNGHTGGIRWDRFLKLPPLWGMAAAFAIRLLNLRLPSLGVNFLELLSLPLGPLMMIALGLSFAPRLTHLGKALLAVFIRMGVGLFIGYLLTLLFGLEGIPRVVVMVCAAMPAGFNTMILADRENMDREFAATIVSISTLIALFYIPLLIHLVR
ncbi:MAG: AEC family transporter [Candidatus Syntrophosphaera sp.]